jgi:inorganic triphosphatase YgiF
VPERASAGTSAAAGVGGSGSATPVEVELKFRLREPGAGEPWLRADAIGPFRAIGPITTTEMVDRYLETPDRGLRAAGYGVRIRTDADGTRLTLKTIAERATPGAAVRREELDGPADPTRPLDRWPRSAALDRLLDIAAGAPIAEVVALRQVRRRRILEAPGGTRVELSLDDVAIEADGRTLERFAELEIELLSGPEPPLVELGALLSADARLDDDGPSKLATAMAAVAAAGAEREAS